MTKYEKVAKKAIDQYMRQNRDREDFILYELSVVADKAASAAGKKRELYSSLGWYETPFAGGSEGFLEIKRAAFCVEPLLPGSCCGERGRVCSGTV